MHRIPNNPSQFSPQQSVSGAEEAHPRSGNMRRSRSSSPLDSSPLVKRRREEVGEAQKSNLGGFNKAKFDDADIRMESEYKQRGITTGMNSLTINDSSSYFAEAFEATNPSYEGDWRLDNDFFPLAMSCDSESQDALPVNDFQAVEENASLKKKRGHRVSWTPKLIELAQEVIQAHANRELKGNELHERLKEKCKAHVPELACPVYESFRINFLGKSRETYVKWTPKLIELAQEVIQAHADRELKGKKMYAELTAKCDAQTPRLACPGYDSFWTKFIKKP